MRQRGLVIIAALLAATAVAGPVGAQTGPPNPKPDPAAAQPAVSSTATQLPVDVDRIRTDLDKPRPLHIDNRNLHFYLEVHPPPISFMALVGNFDLMKGAVPGAAVTGADIARMTTPQNMYSEAGITATDMLQFAATNFAVQKLIQKAASEIRQAKDEKEADQIRARIDKEIAALMAADKGGGSTR